MDKRLKIAEEEVAKEEAAKNLKKIESHEIAWQLNRVANALEEVLRLVKKDQQDTAERIARLQEKENE
jgi:predicted TPR repeat methyltransferase